jgi:von Willebrand factor type A domain
MTFRGRAIGEARAFSARASRPARMVVGLVAIAFLVGGLGYLRRPRPYVLPSLPACRDNGAVLWIFVMDDSGSITAADPQARRYSEARQVAAWLGSQPCNDDDRLGTVHFADGIATTAPARLLDELATVNSGLNIGSAVGVGGGSNMSLALDEVQRMSTQYPNHRTVLVAFSDMQVDRAFVVPRLKKVTDSHLLALGSYDKSWTHDFLTVHVLGSVRPGQASRALAEAVFTSTR